MELVLKELMPQQTINHVSDQDQRGIASDIAKRSYEWCKNQGWTDEEARIWAKAAEDGFGPKIKQ
jgi:hypothetical protein